MTLNCSLCGKHLIGEERGKYFTTIKQKGFPDLEHACMHACMCEVMSRKSEVKEAEKSAETKKQNKEENKKAQKAVLVLLEKRQKWLVSSDFVKSCPEVKNRSKARRILRILAKKNKVQILQHPKRKRRYIFGLIGWKSLTKNDSNN